MSDRPRFNDDQRAYGLRCPTCCAPPGAACNAPTEFSRRPVTWLHSARVRELDKMLEHCGA